MAAGNARSRYPYGLGQLPQHVPVEWDGTRQDSAAGKDLSDGDIVDVEINGQKLTCTVVRTFGQMPGTVSIALGRWPRNRVAAAPDYGVNVNPWLPLEGGLVQYYGQRRKSNDENGTVDKHFASVQDAPHHGCKGQWANFRR